MPDATPSHTLSEADSKALLAGHGIPFAPEELVTEPGAAAAAAGGMGLPVVAKLCGDNIAHKTERGLVRLGLGTPEAVAEATAELLAAALPGESATGSPVEPLDPGAARDLELQVVDRLLGIDRRQLERGEPVLRGDVANQCHKLVDAAVGAGIRGRADDHRHA